MNEKIKKEASEQLLPDGGEINILNGGDDDLINPVLPASPPKQEATIIPNEETAAKLAKEKAAASDIFANPLEETETPEELLLTDETKVNTILDKLYDWAFEADPMEGLV